MRVYDFPDDPVVRGLNVLLVGGAVRDLLLKRPIHERDWVVLGASPEVMLDRGFQPVGKDFPVFLHPTTHEEYALARTERKTAAGHQGFAFYAAPDVTLEDDLSRRDFTINAMAIDSHGALHDPYDGQTAIAQRQLVPVSAAFDEDPLRVIRAARFIAQLPGFSASQALLDRLPAMRDELPTLSVERLWKEASKAFAGDARRFFECLNAWALFDAFGLPAFWHPAHATEGTRDQQLATWNALAPAPLQWPAAWRAPKTILELMADARDWQIEPEQRPSVMLRAGAIKNTPRWQRLYQWIDDDRLAPRLAAARAIKASDFANEHQGPALGQALNTAWLRTLAGE